MVTVCLSLVKVDHELIPGDIVWIALVDSVDFSRIGTHMLCGYRVFVFVILCE